MRRSLAGVLFAAALTCVPAGARDTGPTLIVAMSGDLAQGVLLRAASQAVAGAPGALLRTVWWRGTPSVSLPSGQVLLPGGLPVALRLTFPDAPLKAGETPRVLETSRQRLAAGYLGFGEVSTFKVFPFQKVGEKRLRR